MILLVGSLKVTWKIRHYALWLSPTHLHTVILKFEIFTTVSIFYRTEPPSDIKSFTLHKSGTFRLKDYRLWNETYDIWYCDEYMSEFSAFCRTLQIFMGKPSYHYFACNVKEAEWRNTKLKLWCYQVKTLKNIIFLF